MRVFVTGGAGFVGSNVVAVGRLRGHEVIAPTRSELDLLDAAAVRAAVEDARADCIVHTAILNDFRAIYADRSAAWASYVGVTRTLADAADDCRAALCTVSTDWVFDGTQSGADESTPVNPINYYGVLKAASELVTLERARSPIVARVAGVMGTHRGGRETPRAQDAGFGYFVTAVVDALAAGRPFTVWESDAINMVATPSLASLSAAWMLELVELGARGIFHCCGGEATTRLGLAHAAAEVFELDGALLGTGRPEADALPPAPIPYDTSLDARVTGRTLGHELPSLRELLQALREERRLSGSPGSGA